MDKATCQDVVRRAAAKPEVGATLFHISYIFPLLPLLFFTSPIFFVTIFYSQTIYNFTKFMRQERTGK
jgi:ABC-type multidrug transport system permease subunit